MERAAEFIPACVVAIAVHWRTKGSRQAFMPLGPGPLPEAERASTKVGRDDPCRCSGKRFKKCYGNTAFIRLGHSRLLSLPSRMRSRRSNAARYRTSSPIASSSAPIVKAAVAGDVRMRRCRSICKDDLRRRPDGYSAGIFLAIQFGHVAQFGLLEIIVLDAVG